MKLNKKNSLAIFFSLLTFPALFAQTYNLVKDIKSGSQSSLSWADPYVIPQLIGEFQNRLILQAEGDNSLNTELWVSDGTEAGTVLLTGKDASWTSLFVKEKGLAFFSLEEGEDETGIYQYDGVNLTKLAVGGEYYPSEFTYFNDQLYYVAEVAPFNTCLLTPSGDVDNPICIMELESPSTGGVAHINGQLIGFGEASFNSPFLFRTDGTGTDFEFFYDLTSNSNANWSPNWIEGDGQLFFFYQPGGAGTSMGLYVTDGTEAGTQYLIDLWNNGIYPKSSKDKAFYQGNLLVGGVDFESEFGRELYKSDGTVNGTALLKDINPNGDADPGFFVEYNGLIYFVAIDESGKKQLWQTDGTAAGTVASLSTTFSGTNNYSGDFLTVYDGLLAFVGFNNAEGREIWLSDGTDAGTYAITDESPSGNDDFLPRELVAVDNNLFFTRYVPSTGRELYVYNNGQANSFLSGAAANIACNDNQTMMDPDDDFITFDLTTSSFGLGSTFNISVAGETISPNSGAYNQPISFSVSAIPGNGDVTATISDGSDPNRTITVLITDPGLCSDAVAVNELEMANAYLDVQPNPFYDQVVFETQHLDLGEDYSLEIFSSNGQLLNTMDMRASDRLHIDLSVFKSAILFYQLKNKANGQTIQSGKLIGL